MVVAAQRDRSHEDRGGAADPGEHARALEGDVGGADDAGLAGVPLQAEEVVRGDAVLPRAGAVLGERRPAAHRENDVPRPDAGGLAVFIGEVHPVRVGRVEDGAGVVVEDALLAELDVVAEVERFDVHNDVVSQRPPVAPRGGRLPAVRGRKVPDGLAAEGGGVHELLRDAADVDAGAAEAPLGAERGGGGDVVADGDVDVEVRGPFGAGEAAGAAADDEELVLKALGGRFGENVWVQKGESEGKGKSG